MHCDASKYQELVTPVTQRHMPDVLKHQRILWKQRCSIQQKWQVQAILNTHLRGRC